MKILFVGVFSEGSTNNPQRDCLRQLGHIVDEFSYRSITNCNSALVLHSIKQDYDMLLIAKAPEIMTSTIKLFKQNNPGSITVLWFMDPIRSYNNVMMEKTAVCDIAYFDKKNVLSIAKKYNKNSHYLCEGFDESSDYKHNVPTEYDVSFIGNIYNNRDSFLANIPNIKLLSGVYGSDHSLEVSKTRINLNICTDAGASDRIYKILAAGGFLLTNEWEGRELTGLVDGRDLVIYNDIGDLNNKINLYLDDVDRREKIAESGFRTVQKLNRLEWAKYITYEK